MSDHFGHVGEDLVHQGAIVGFFHGYIGGPDGSTLRRDIVRHPGAVAVVAVDGDAAGGDEPEVILVQQYRAALDAELIEIPAGKRDVPDEPPIDTARRELEEEIGMKAGNLEPLINIHHSPGFCDEYGHLFLATDLTPVPDRREGAEEQAMRVHRIPLSEAVAMCFDGGITDAKSIAGLLAAAHRLGGR